MSQNFRFFVKPGPGERVETALTLPQENRALLLGTVRSGPEAAPVRDAAVLLFDSESHRPLLQAYTDEDGVFVLGPLEPERLYIVNVARGDAVVRTLEISV